MAKKDLSQAAGLDALFRRPTLPVEDMPLPVEEEPKAKPTVQKTVEKESPKPKEKPKAEKKKKEVPVEKHSEPAPKPKKRQAQPKSNIFSVNLEAIRKNEVKYTGIRLKRDLFERLGKIADKEKVKSTNSLISKVLEAFCDGYEGEG